MKNLLSRIGLVAMMAVAGLAGLQPAAARADDFGIEFRFGNDDGYNTRHYKEYRWGHNDRRGCRPERALRIARHEGLRRAEIVRITPRVVVVRGRTPYGWDKLVFANVRGCPMIDR